MEPYKFPLPPTDQDFEALIERLVSDQHPDAVVQKYGRNGQAQHGVDVLLTRADGTRDGLQCKHVKSLGKDTILEEAEKAKAFPGGLSRFIIYSTTPRDTKDQDAASEATAKLKFLVMVSSWDDIAVDMMNNLRASQAYMAKLPIHELKPDYFRQLRVAFDRDAFTVPAAMEWSHQEQLQAVRDVQEFLSTGRLDTRDARFVLRSLPAAEVPGARKEIAEVRKNLNLLKSQVTLAARAEVNHNFEQVAALSPAIDMARKTLLETLNSSFEANLLAPIDFS